MRSGEMPSETHGSERLAFHNARLGSTNQAQPQVSVTQTPTPSISTKQHALPPALRIEKREGLTPGLGEKLYRVA